MHFEDEISFFAHNYSIIASKKSRKNCWYYFFCNQLWRWLKLVNMIVIWLLIFDLPIKHCFPVTSNDCYLNNNNNYYYLFAHKDFFYNFVFEWHNICEINRNSYISERNNEKLNLKFSLRKRQNKNVNMIFLKIK